MKSLLLNDIEKIREEADRDIAQANDLPSLEQLKSLHCGKNSRLVLLLKHLRELAEDERPRFGQELNSVKQQIMNRLAERHEQLKQLALEKNLNFGTVDVTLPSRGQNLGSSHPVTKIRRRFEDFFIKMGFMVVDGPEIENDFYNFTALNIPKYHPARTSHDTFYFADGTMLRSQTSTVQIRAMEQIAPPLRVICPGRVFRRDNDATHSPMFHQCEMLMVEEGLTFANLKWLVIEFIKYFFHENIEYRFRPSYFPFTEPSAEVDIKWQTKNGSRWLELGGLGVVHPNVLKMANVDPQKFRGLAFGFGMDRPAMIQYGIDDIRRLFENDLQFLEQFSGF